MEINLDQTILFSEYRGVVRSVERKIDSRIKGHLRTDKYIVDSELNPMKNLILKLNIDLDNNEVKISEFRLELINPNVTTLNVTVP